VTLATHRPIEPDARRLGLGFAPIEGNPRQVLETEQGARGWRPAAIRCVAHGGCWRWPAPWRRRGISQLRLAAEVASLRDLVIADCPVGSLPAMAAVLPGACDHPVIG
jgi:hypothetical protein